jgi:penicillin-binding protein A
MNKRIRRLAVGLLVCYLVLFVQLNILQVDRRQELAANPKNNRAVLRDFDKPRGRIITADGVTIAQTDLSEAVVTDKGTGSKFQYQRSYPQQELFANVTGYYTFAYGATKLEKVYGDVLTGQTAGQFLPGLLNKDNTGSVLLTVRADLQQIAREALGEREGSVVVLDPKTGAVLAMWSYPSYDPNLVAVHDNKLAGQILEFLNGAPGKPTLSNAYQDRYMPGSTFKVITTGIALQKGLINFDSAWATETEYLPPQTIDPIQNYGGGACGGDLREVFRRSCNTPFARIAVELGADTMVAGAKDWGIGEKLPFDLPGAVSSTFGEVSDFDQAIPKLAIRGFGQDEDQMVPLHMAMVAATVANGGKMMKPYIVDATVDHSGGVLDSTEPSAWKQPLSAENAAILNELMVGVVQSGTAQCCMQLDGGIQAAAKTGTAQLNAAGQPQRSHAWIIGFAPAEAPQYAIAVVLKGTNAEISAGTGGKLAGPIAKTVLDYALAHPLTQG